MSGNGPRARVGVAAAALLLGTLMILALALPPGVQATEDAPMTLSQAVAKALARNHGLAAKRHACTAATWNQRQARAQLLPSLSLESGYTRLDDETVARANVLGREMTMYFPDSTGQLQPVTIEIPQSVFRDGYQTSLSAQLLLFNPALWNASALASTSKQMADWQCETTRQETVHQTLRAFVELLKVRSLVDVQRQHLEQARQNLAQAQRLFDVGRYAEADVLRWRVEEARQSGILLQQGNMMRVRALRLENLIGDPPRGTLEPDTLLPGELSHVIERFRRMDQPTWTEFMHRSMEEETAQNPQLRILDRALRLAELEHRQSLTTALPRMTVAGSYGWQNNDTPKLDGEQTWSISAILSVPLFTSGVNYSARQATKWRVSQTREEVTEARRAIILSAETQRTAIRNYADLLRLTETSLESARRNYEIRRNSFTLGRLSNLEWIDAHLMLQTAEQMQVSAYYDLVLAIADLHQARGRIMELTEE
jgi:multidrug efflux system outer membrane protein